MSPQPLEDAHGRRISDLRVSVTDRCNFRCQYCMPADGIEWLPRDGILSFEEIARLVRLLVSLGIQDVRLTGGERARRVDPRRLASSISLSNLAAGLSGGLPICHGAGGVTAHYRLGARTAGATLMVGALYVTLGLAVGASLPAFLHLLAPGALAGMPPRLRGAPDSP